MAKQRGYPDRRGMGAQSDFISESFIPSDRHKEQLLMRAETLIALGIAPEKGGRNALPSAGLAAGQERRS
jgi:hypothetical protein